MNNQAENCTLKDILQEHSSLNRKKKIILIKKKFVISRKYLFKFSKINLYCKIVLQHTKTPCLSSDQF